MELDKFCPGISETTRSNLGFQANPDLTRGTVVIDVKDCNGERICRICHLESDQLLESVKAEKKAEDLIELGCSCKGELEIVHPHCANAWFKLKGNRLCEICGQIAMNVTVIGDDDSNRFMEEWNGTRSVNGDGVEEEENRSECLRGQPFCNFLLACLIIAFVLPWFLRVSMF